MARLTTFVVRMEARGAAGFRREAGQTMAEYGLILAGIAIVVMASVLVLGPQIATTFTHITTCLSGGAGC